MARVLVVDDDLDMLKMVAYRLRGQGHRVVAATSGAGALRTLEAMEVPHVMVVDVSMAEMDGLTLVAAIRENAATADVPVIFLSARDGSDDIRAGRALNARYLTKPLVVADLLAAIEASTRAVSGVPWQAGSPGGTGSPAART